jgi:hypothetical protein
MHRKHVLICLLPIVLFQTTTNGQCSKTLLQSALLNIQPLCIWFKPVIEIKSKISMRFSARNLCGLQQKTLVSAQEKHLFYPAKFLTVKQVITVGGYFTIRDLLWNNSDQSTCNTSILKWCERNDGSKCYFNEKQIFRASQQVLKTKNVVKVLPIVSENVESLPFPSTFNLSIVNIKSSNVCKENKIFICHLVMEDECSYYMCHHGNSKKSVLQMKLKYQNPSSTSSLIVDMTMICDYFEFKKMRNTNSIIYKMLKENGGSGTLCHFASPQTTFLLCALD